MQGAALLRLSNRGARPEGVEVHVPVFAPQELGLRGGECVDERALESVVFEAFDLESVFVGVLAVHGCSDGLLERRRAVLRGEAALAAEREDGVVGGAVDEVVAGDL